MYRGVDWGKINFICKRKVYIKTNILRDAPDVPTIVIKAVGSDYEEVTDKDQLGVFLPQVKFTESLSLDEVLFLFCLR